MKIICVGRNYADHAKELKNDLPTVPIIFMKPKGAILLPEKPLYYPDFTDDLQYECEVVVKICKNGKFIQEKFADKYYNEVTLGIDFTARDVQREQQSKGLPWEIAKAFDSSAVTGSFKKVSELEKSKGFHFHLLLNGHKAQEGNTNDMIFPFSHIISYASQFFTLQVGDLIYTGTPAGVGVVKIGDRLEGFLEGDKVFDFEIK